MLSVESDVGLTSSTGRLTVPSGDHSLSPWVWQIKTTTHWLFASVNIRGWLTRTSACSQTASDTAPACLFALSWAHSCGTGMKAGSATGAHTEGQYPCRARKWLQRTLKNGLLNKLLSITFKHKNILPIRKFGNQHFIGLTYMLTNMFPLPQNGKEWGEDSLGSWQGPADKKMNQPRRQPVRMVVWRPQKKDQACILP